MCTINFAIPPDSTEEEQLEIIWRELLKDTTAIGIYNYCGSALDQMTATGVRYMRDTAQKNR
jgi:hypothetical protein